MARTAQKQVSHPNAAALPTAFRPQLATLVENPPPGDEWVHEVKFDGYRIGCRIEGNDIRLISRNGNDWTANFPEVRQAAAQLNVQRAFLDGEVAVVLADGRTSFQALQNVSNSKPPRDLTYFVFDLLHLDGEDIARLPLEKRKERVKRLLESASGAGCIRYADHISGHGPEFFQQACRLGLEGIVSKRRDMPYQPGRNDCWLKAKCLQRQEFVVGGFTDPEGSRVGLGALLVGVRNDTGALVYAGKVGTGFTQKSARELRRRLDALEQKHCPFATRPPGSLGRNAHWVQPVLAAEVTFTEWTQDGKIRHPSFQGMREDKPATEIRRESPVAPPTGQHAVRHVTEVAGVRLTHPDRVLFPEIGLTKRGLAEYYEAIADWMLPHLAGRPLTLVRCPEGVGTSCFYMKHSRVWAPAGLRRVRIAEKKKLGEYLIADSLPALIGLVQMDVLEIHDWNSQIERVEQPDRLVLDLDPGPEVQWSDLIEAARLVRMIFEALGLQSFVKTTGGVGLHIVVPLLPEADWNTCLAVARAIAETMERHNPRVYTSAFAKRGRERKILIDYLRNNRTNTSVAAFSTRAKARATVSAPLAWDELSSRLRSDHYTVQNLPKRLAALKEDPWKSYWTTRQRLPTHAPQALAGL